MSESNYECVRAKLGLWSWDADAGEHVEREPTNGEIVRLLDALHADITGSVGDELQKAIEDRYWNS